MSKVLDIKIGTRYSFEYLVNCFGEKNIDGVDTPEIKFELGDRTINLVFESERTIIDLDEYVPIGSNSYTLKEITTWSTKE